MIKSCPRAIRRKRVVSSSERGFVMLEVVALSAVIVAMAAVVASYQAAERARQMAAVRTTAVFLAKEELARLEQKAYRHELHGEDYGWLGEPQNLRLNGYEFTVRATVDGYETGVCRAEAAVKYRFGNRNHEVIFTRLVPDKQ